MSTLRTRLAANFGANLVGQGVGVLGPLCSVPLMLHFWGETRYGEWLLLSAVSAYLTVSDLGFISAGANEMSMAAARDDKQATLTTYQTILALVVAIGAALTCVLSVVFWIVPIEGLIGLATVPHEIAYRTVLLLSVETLLSLHAGVLAAGFRCCDGYAKGSIESSAIRLVQLVSVLMVVALSGSVVAVATAMLVVRIAGNVGMWASLRREHPWVRLGMRHARLREARHLAAPAFAYTAFPLGNAMLLQGVAIAVGATVGPAALVAFSVHRMIVRTVRRLLDAINLAVWPEMSKAYGHGDLDLARRLHRESCQAALWGAIGVSVALLAGGKFIVPFWTAGRVRFSYGLFGILMIAMFAHTSWLTSSVVSVATNQHKRIAVLYALSGTLSVGAVWCLAERFLLNGAAIGLLMGEAAMLAAVLPNSLKLLDERIGDFLAVLLSPPLIRFRQELRQALRYIAKHTHSVPA